MVRLTWILLACLLAAPVGTASADPASGARPQAKPASQKAGPGKGAEGFSQPEATFREVFDMLLKKHVNSGLTREELYRAAIQGMLEHASPELSSGRPRGDNSFHPSNGLLSPDELESLRTRLSGRMVGIGVYLDKDSDSGNLEVIEVMHNSPAERAGLKARDLIVGVDGVRFDDSTPREMRPMIPGPANTPVRLMIQRDAQQLELRVMREEIQIETAIGELLPPDIGLLRLMQFSDDTPRQTREILAELKNRGIKGLVIDLRNNGGGSMDALLQVLDLFIARGKTVLMTEDRGGARKNFVSKGGQLLEVPMVVLIDDRTASSAEVLSMALQEQTGAKLVGERTYGKATGEEILPLLNGYAVKISLTRLLSPRGRHWGVSGIQPDVELKMSDAEVNRSRSAPNIEERLKLDRGLKRAVQLLAP